MAAETRHPRLILRNFLSPTICKELQFIHKSCCTVGYRPNVFSTTLSHLIATNSAHLLMPFVPIRERLKEKVEECFGCQYELVVEFTGLISWTRGASIGWHSDDNRPYLKQRAFAVVCYLNSYNEDFRGGLFHFQDGEPSTIVPMAGDVLMYTADNKNIHAVDEAFTFSPNNHAMFVLNSILASFLDLRFDTTVFSESLWCILIKEGERITLTLWFSRDVSHDEDAKLISILSQGSLASYLPVPASNNMYWFPPDESLTFQSGFDIRCARLHLLGLDFCPSDPAVNSSCNLLELLMGPLKLAYGDELFDREFVNIMHILQVVQFYCYRQPFFQSTRSKGASLSAQAHFKAQGDDINHLKLVVLKDRQQAETFITNLTCGKELQFEFDWVSLSAALVGWETYSAELHKKLVLSFPHWKKHESIFDCPLGDFGETTT